MYCRIRKLHFIFVTLLLIAFMLSAISSTALAGPPWSQIYKLTARDSTEYSYFGNSVAISDQFVVVGAYWYRSDAGAAYVYDLSTGKQMFKLLASDSNMNDNFGNSVAVSGNLALIGTSAPFKSAYVFDLTTGDQIYILKASDEEHTDYFGTSVAMSGNLAVVGSKWHSDNGYESGAAYIFDAPTGKQLFKLLASDGTSNDTFGFSVAISGNLAIIGAPFSNNKIGSAYVFDAVTGQELMILHPTEGARYDRIGQSVAISGDKAIVGAPYDGDNGPDSGSAYIFDLATGQELHKLLAFDGSKKDHFGNSVAINSNLAIVGAYGNNNENGDGAGAAYVFDITTGNLLYKILASDAQDYKYFSFGATALSGNTAVIGASYDNDGGIHAGAAYVFDQIPSALTVSPDPLISRQDGVFSILQGLPNEQTWLIYSLEGLQQSFIRKLNVIIDLSHPKIAVKPRQTDINGDLQFVLPMPDTIKGIPVWFQAVQHRNVTNYVETELIP